MKIHTIAFNRAQQLPLSFLMANGAEEVRINRNAASTIELAIKDNSPLDEVLTGLIVDDTPKQHIEIFTAPDGGIVARLCPQEEDMQNKMSAEGRVYLQIFNMNYMLRTPEPDEEPQWFGEIIA